MGVFACGISTSCPPARSRAIARRLTSAMPTPARVCPFTVAMLLSSMAMGTPGNASSTIARVFAPRAKVTSGAHVGSVEGAPTRTSSSSSHPAGLFVGGLTGTAGGAGVLFAPVLLSVGLTGSAFVATTSSIAFATHAGRLLAYGGTGILSRDLVFPTLVTTLAIFAGNALGERLRTLLSARGATRIEHATLAVCAALSVIGLA
jgi:uncharacterized membrane protein YfcA